MNKDFKPIRIQNPYPGVDSEIYKEMIEFIQKDIGRIMGLPSPTAVELVEQRETEELLLLLV